MKKIIVVPDVHGRTHWKKAADKLTFGEVDEMVFVGDYFDSFNINGEDQINNFLDIVEFQKNNLDRVTLLTGNHDLQYITDMPCSGYQAGNHWTIKNLLQPLMVEDKLQMVKIIGKYLFVHAGISKTWCNRYNIDIKNLEESVNSLFKRSPTSFDFQDVPNFPPFNKMGYHKNISHYGDNVWQSPTWIRPDSLALDKIKGYIQVVGHTHMNCPTFKNDIWFTDCHEYDGDDFLVLNIGEEVVDHLGSYSIL